MPNCLIMGGSYFIGKAVLETLKYHMTCYVINRGSHPINDPDVIELKSDRKDKENMTYQLKGLSFDYVVDISAYDKHDIDILLDVMDISNLKSYVFISTAAVYDSSIKKLPYSEDDKLGGQGPYQAYGNHKIDAEKTLMKRLKEDKVVIFRPPYVYGPYNYVLRERLIFHLIDHDLPVYLPLSQARIQFVYVYDLARDILEALKHVIPAGIYNVGSTKTITFHEWIKMIQKVMDKKADIRFVNDDIYHIKTTDYFPFMNKDIMLDVSKIKAYHPYETDMLIGLKHAYDDYLKIKDEIKVNDRFIDTWMKLNLLLG